MKRIIRCVLGGIAVVVALGLIARVVLNFVEVGVLDSQEKPYRAFSSNTESLGYKLGATILRPIVESRIDKYLKDQGMEEYLWDLKLRAFPVDNFSFVDVEPGEGPKALCGQEVSAVIISVPMPGAAGSEKSSGSMNLLQSASKRILGTIPASTIKESMKSVSPSGNFSPTTLKIGTHEVSAVNYSLSGMRKNGSRVVTVDGSQGSAASHHYILVKSINNRGYPTDRAMKSFMVFDKADDSPRRSPITVARCGDKVSLLYKIRNLDGDLVTQGKIGEFTIGAREVPLAFDLGAVDLRSDVVRSIVVHPEFLKGFDMGEERGKSINILDLQMEPTTNTKDPSQISP